MERNGSTRSQVSTSKQTSKIDLKTTSFTWTIENFSFHELQSRGKHLESKKFSNNSTNSEWSLLFYPRIRIFKMFSVNGFTLCLKMNTKRIVTAKFKFSIKDSNDLTLYETEYFAKQFTQSKNVWTKRIFTTCRNLHQYLFNDVLKLHVGIIEMVDTADLAYTTEDSPFETLGRDLGNMLKNKKFCDLIIRVEGQDINVHKVVLAGASPVFAAMLQHETLERHTKTIVISDLTADSVSHMVQFIYDRKCPNFKAMDIKQCLEILKAADKYALNDLIELVANHLISILDCDNVLGIIVVADIYYLDDLKLKCLEFIQNGDNAIIDLNNLDVLEGRPDLMKEIILRLV